MATLGPCCGQHPPLARPLGDITTGRLDLRRFRADDLDELAAVFATVEVWRYPFGRARGTAVGSGCGPPSSARRAG